LLSSFILYHIVTQIATLYVLQFFRKKKLRDISDELCLENNLSVVKNAEKSKGKSWWEYQQHKQGLSWKSQLKNTIDEAIMDSMDFMEL